MTRVRNLTGLFVVLADLAVCAVLWARLPARVPLHWNFHGVPDRYGSRLELLAWGPLLLITLWGLLAVAFRTDPRQRAPRDPDAPAAEQGDRVVVEALVLGLLAVLHISVALKGAGLVTDVPRVFAGALAVFLLLMGNFMGRVRPNFFVGVRTPWTLSSPTVWRRTHRLAARASVVAGLLALGAVGLLPGMWAMGVTVGLLVITATSTTVASWYFWRAEERA